MNKIFAGAVVAMTMASPLISLAAVVDCNVTPLDPACPRPTNGNPYEVTNAWGLTGAQSQKYWVAPGTKLVMKNGTVGECPWFIFHGCYDLRWYYEGPTFANLVR